MGVISHGCTIGRYCHSYLSCNGDAYAAATEITTANTNPSLGKEGCVRATATFPPSRNGNVYPQQQQQLQQHQQQQPHMGVISHGCIIGRYCHSYLSRAATCNNNNKCFYSNNNNSKYKCFLGGILVRCCFPCASSAPPSSLSRRDEVSSCSNMQQQ